MTEEDIKAQAHKLNAGGIIGNLAESTFIAACHWVLETITLEKYNKNSIQRLQEADDDITVETLSDEELQQYCDIMNNGYTIAVHEQRNRGL